MDRLTRKVARAAVRLWLQIRPNNTYSWFPSVSSGKFRVSIVLMWWPLPYVVAPSLCVGPFLMWWPLPYVLAPSLCVGPFLMWWPLPYVLAPSLCVGPFLMCWLLPSKWFPRQSVLITYSGGNETTEPSVLLTIRLLEGRTKSCGMQLHATSQFLLANISTSDLPNVTLNYPLH